MAAGLGNEALTTTTYFDGLGRGIKREQTGPSQPTPTTIITQTEYNITGTVKRAATPRFSTDATLLWTNPQYDALGRVVRVDLPSPAGQSIRSLSCYDDWVTVTIDANNHKKRETRDAYGRLIRVDEYTGTFTACDTAVGTPYATTTYQYDVLGNLVKLTDAKGNVTTMRYDSLGRKIAMSDPDMGRCGDLTALTPNATYPWYSAPCWNYQYDAAGNLIQQTDAKGQHLYFQYDALNRRTQKDLLTQKAPGSGDVRYLYDPSGYCASTGKGRLWQIVSANAWTNLCYDGVGRVVVSQNTVLDGSGSSNGGETSFSYDTLGRLARVTYPNNLEEEGIVWPSQVVYEYTGPLLKRVYEVSQAYGVGEVYAQYSNYNALGQPGTVAFGNGTNTTYTYQPQTSRMEAYRTALGGSTYLHELYTYDAQGNVTFVWDQQSGAERQFSYDALDRFSSSGYWDGPDGNSFDFTATYDQIGNLTDSTMTSAVTFTAPVTLGAYTYPPSGPTSVRPHAVSTTTKPNLTTTYLYDANGNLSQGAGRKIDYDLENHPTCVATTTGVCSAASTKTQFFYDGDGQRVGKKKGTAQTVFYVNQYFECVGQNGGSGATNCTKYIWANGRRIAMRNAPYATSPGQPQPATAVSYYHADHLGSTRLVTGPNGATEQAAVYWPWGNMQYSDGQGGVRYKFTGQELDETGLYDYHARLYDPVLGRFITADTLVPNPGNPQDLNRYTYARNNPLLYTDPSGHFGIIEGIIFGVVIGAVASGIQSDWDLGSMIQGGVIGGMSGGVGAGIGTSVFQATVGSLGQTWAGVAGGVVGGAAAGGTSGVLASAAGYKVNIGLAIASGAAAGGIAGGAGAWGAQHGYGELTAFAASPVAGAAAAAIRGSDPGVGAAIAAATAAFSFSIQSFMNNHNLAGRELTAEEMKAAWSVFGNRMDYASVKIFDSKYFWTQASHYAVTPDGNIYWPSDSCGNMVVCGDSNLFIHEMTHVMQYQQGISVLGQGFLLQAGHFGSLTVYDPYSFTYDPTRAFSSYNIEQQGSLAEGIYRGVYTNNID